MRRIDRQLPIARHRLVTTMATFVLLVTVLGLAGWPGAGLRAAPEEASPTEIVDQQPDPSDVIDPALESPTEVPTEVLDAPIDPAVEPTVPVDPTAEPVPTELVLEIPATEGTLDPPPSEDAEEVVPDIIGPTPTFVPDGSPGTVSVVAYTCLPGYEAAGAGLATLEADCRADATLTDFTVANDAGFAVTQPASLTRPPFMQQATFRDVPPGVISISEVMPPGHGAPIVFCSSGALTSSDWIPMSVTGGNSVGWNLASGSVLDCIFFNVQLGTPVAMDDNTLTIVTFACPTGTNREAGLPDLGTTCDPMPDISFAVTYPGSGAYGTSDAAGRIDWTGIPAGAWTVFENIPAGYGHPVVFCGPMYETETPPVSVVAGEFVGEFTGTDQHTVCSVFNIPVETPVEPGTGPVTVKKYACPAGVERSDVAYTLSEQCTTEIYPVAFVILAGDTYVERVTATAGVPQTAEFADVPFGPIGIIEAIPAGYGEPLVFCADTTADGPGAYVPVPLVSPDAVSVDHRADAEIPLSCLFFNFLEAEDNTVTVDKYVCPPEANAETDVLIEVCTLGGDGIEFEFVDGSGSRSASGHRWLRGLDRCGDRPGRRTPDHRDHSGGIWRTAGGVRWSADGRDWWVRGAESWGGAAVPHHLRLVQLRRW